MANAIDRVKQDIQKRLDELESERDQLMRALEALTGDSSQVRRRGRPPGTGATTGSAAGSRGEGRKRGGGRRAARGQRRQQVLDALEGRELGPSAIAREVGVNPTQISSLLRALAAEGRVERSAGGKWRLGGGGGDQPAPAAQAGGAPDGGAVSWPVADAAPESIS